MDTQQDRQQQMEACRELAPQGQYCFIDRPWKALENALRNRNFENKQLIDRVAVLENFILAQHTMLQELRRDLEEEFITEADAAGCTHLAEIDELKALAEQLLRQKL